MSKQEVQANIMMPREDAFEGKNQLSKAIMPGGATMPIYERTEYPDEGGIYVYYRGMKYPKKGFPYPEAVWANDIVKRVTMTMINTLGIKEMVLPIASMLLLPWKKKMKVLERALENYNRVGDWLFKDHYLATIRYSNPSMGIRSITTRFLDNLGLSESTSRNFAKILATMIEYDDAYRYRIQDIVTEANWEELYHEPITEMKRLAEILISREHHPQVMAKVRSLVLIMNLLMLHPKIRKAFKKTVDETSESEKKSLILDNSDRYHILLRGDYNFLGRTFEERRKIYIDFHTRSKCCDAGVTEFEQIEYREPEKEPNFITRCNKCGKECEVIQEMPPMFELSHNR